MNEIICDKSLTSFLLRPSAQGLDVSFDFLRISAFLSTKLRNQSFPTLFLFWGSLSFSLCYSARSYAAFVMRCLVRPNSNFTKPSNSCCQVIFFARTEYSLANFLLPGITLSNYSAMHTCYLCFVKFCFMPKLSDCSGNLVEL